MTIFFLKQMIFFQIFSCMLNCIYLDAYEDSHHILIETNQQCEQLWRMYFICIKFYDFCIINSLAILSVLLNFVLHERFDVDHLYHMMKIV